MLLGTASNPAKNHGAVGETEGPLLFSRVDCHSYCYSFPILKLLCIVFFAVVYRHLQYETVLRLSSCIYFYIFSLIVQAKKRARNNG